MRLIQPESNSMPWCLDYEDIEQFFVNQNSDNSIPSWIGIQLIFALIATVWLFNLINLVVIPYFEAKREGQLPHKC